MNAAAKAVMTDLPDVAMAYGVSDEYRYVDLCEAAAPRNAPSTGAAAF